MKKQKLISTKNTGIGQNIKQQRHLKGLTQTKLAELSGINYVTLTKIESGVIQNPSVTIVKKLSTALGTSLDVLVSPLVFSGDAALTAIWNDTLETLQSPGDFICISGIDERQYLKADRPGIMRFIENLKSRGFGQKLLCCEGNSTRLLGEHLEYRYLPKENFSAVPIYVYRNKVALLLWGPPRQVIILENSALAETFHKQFMFMWKRARKSAK